MRAWLCVLVPMGAMLLIGCGEGADAEGTTQTDTAVGAETDATGDGQHDAGGGHAAATPVAVQAGSVTLSPENTKIEFVGSKPSGDSHNGGFRDFTGRIEIDPESKAVKSITVDIKTESIWSDNEKLTGHLKTQDFFEVREHPTAKFQSKSVEAADVANEYTVIGDLTLLDETKEITFPATIVMEKGGLKLNSQFKLDRTQFGMTYGEGQINPDVAMFIVVGASPAAEAPQAGGEGQGQRRRWRSFEERDSNGDSKLSGEEISERMREGLENIDTDGDEAISKEEFDAWLEEFRQRRQSEPRNPA